MSYLCVLETECNSSGVAKQYATKARVIALGKTIRSDSVHEYTDNQIVAKRDVIANTQTVYKDVSVGTTQLVNDSGTVVTGDIPVSGGKYRARAQVSYKEATQTNYLDGDPTVGTYTSKTAYIYGDYVEGSALTTSITKRTKKGTSTPSGTVAGAARTGTATDIYQAANVVTAVTVSATLSYANIAAGATSSAAPTKSASVTQFTLTSGSKLTSTPSSTYGTLSGPTWSGSYSIANKTTNGFTDINTSTGVLTATSYGTTAGAARKSATVTGQKATFTWTPASGYGSAVSGNATPTATCTQNANALTGVTLKSTPSAGTITAPATFAAKGDTTGVSTTNTGATSYTNTTLTATYTSGASKDVTATSGVYSWSISGSVFTITGGNGANTTVKVGSRGTTYGTSERTATLTRTVVYGYTDNGVSKTVNGPSCTCTVKQAANTYTVAVTTGTGGAITVPTFTAAGNTTGVATTSTTAATAAASARITVTYASTSTTIITPSSMAYSWSINDNSVISITGGTSATTTVKCASAGTTSSAQKSATITRTATYTYTLDSASKTIALTATGTSTRAANALTSVAIASGGSAGAIKAPGNYSAGAQSQTVTSTTAATTAANTTLTATYTSGESKTVTAASMTYSWTSGTTANFTLTSANAAQLSVTSVSRGTEYSDSTRTSRITRKATYSYTDNGVTKSVAVTCSCTVTQAANTFTAAVTTGSAGAIAAPTFTAAGNTTGAATTNTTSATAAANARVTLTYASTKTLVVTPTSMAYSWTAGSSTVITITGGTAATTTVKCTSAGAMASAAVNVTLTRKATYSYTENGNARTIVIQCTCTATRPKNELVYTYGTPSITTLSYGSVNEAGGTLSPTISYTQSRSWKYSSGDGAGSDIVTSGGTITYSIPTTTGFSINTSTGVVTVASTTGSSRSVVVTAKVTVNSKTSANKTFTITQSCADNWHVTTLSESPSSQSQDSFYRICHLNGDTFVTMATHSSAASVAEARIPAVYYTTDAENFTRVSSSPMITNQDSHNIGFLKFGNKILIYTINYTTSSTVRAYQTTNGTTYTLAGTITVEDVAAGNISIGDPIYVNNLGLMIYNKAIYYSENGINWIKAYNVGSTATGISNIVWTGSTFYVYCYVNSSSYFILSSTDGKVWTKATYSGTAYDIYYIKYFKNNFYCIRNTKIYKSSNMQSWTEVASFTSTTSNTYESCRYLFGDDTIMMTGTVYRQDQCTYKSLDGSTWTKVPVKTGSYWNASSPQDYNNNTLYNGLYFIKAISSQSTATASNPDAMIWTTKK